MKFLFVKDISGINGLSFLVLQKPHCKHLPWKYIKNKSRKSYLGNKDGIRKSNISSSFSIVVDQVWILAFVPEKTGRDEIKFVQVCKHTGSKSTVNQTSSLSFTT